MAYDFEEGSSQYLSTGSPAITATPLTIAARFNVEAVDAETIIASIADADGSNYFSLLVNGSGEVKFEVLEDGSVIDDASYTGATASAGTWYTAIGRTASDTSKYANLGTGKSAQNTTDITPIAGNLDNVYVGTRVFGGSPEKYWDGFLCDVGFWNVELSDDEVAAYDAGFSCGCIRPANLAHWFPMIRDLVDVPGGGSITNSGSATVTANPPGIIMPESGLVVSQAGGGGGGGSSIVVLAEQSH